MNDKISRGIIQNLVLAGALYISGLISAYILFEIFSIPGMLPFWILETIPLSFTVSGIINGIYFNRRSCPKAAKANLVIAIVTFVIGGSCMLMVLSIGRFAG
ncbi:MAG: hypothetical protein GY754_03240 [bacterium]|nr:hypothetical protein [bacterium]